MCDNTSAEGARDGALTRIAAGVGHAINNPLTVVLANLEFAAEALRELAARPDLAPEIGAALGETLELLGDANVAADRIRSIVGDLRTLESPPGSLDALEVPAPPAPAPATSTRRGRILIVDDEPAVVNAVARIVSRDHDITATSVAQDVIERIRRGERYDVILSDLMMPHVTGMELHAAIVSLAPHQAAVMVFLTGGAFTPAAATFLAEVSNLRLEKPFTPRSLLAVIEQCMAR